MHAPRPRMQSMASCRAKATALPAAAAAAVRGPAAAHTRARRGRAMACVPAHFSFAEVPGLIVLPGFITREEEGRVMAQARLLSSAAHEAASRLQDSHAQVSAAHNVNQREVYKSVQLRARVTAGE